MKSSFKNLSFFLIIFLFLFFLTSFSLKLPLYSQERNIIVITHNLKGRTQALLAYKVLKETFKIPIKLIQKIQKESPCSKIEDAILHICIDDKNELQIVGGNEEIFVAHFRNFQKEDKK